MSRKYLHLLHDIKAYLCKKRIEGKKVNFNVMAQELMVSPHVLDVFLGAVLRSDMGNAEMHVLCANMYQNIFPADMCSATMKISITVAYPPKNIFAAIAGQPVGLAEHYESTPQGRELMALYIAENWHQEFEASIQEMSDQMDNSGVVETLEKAYPQIDYTNPIAAAMAVLEKTILKCLAEKNVS